MAGPLIQAQALRIRFGQRPPVVDGISFSLFPGRIVALVGESGSGKSLTARALLGLLPSRPAPTTGGTIHWQPGSTDTLALHTLDEAAWRSLRGRRIGLVLQDPMNSLHPARTIRKQLAETLPESARTTAHLVRRLAEVQLQDAERLLNSYPHQLSGGQLQRICLAMALLNEPDLLIADEPTTALDQEVQQEIIRLLLKLRRQRGLAILFITHDLDLVRQLADVVWVMRRGRLLEQQATESLFRHPQTAYTKTLLAPRVRPPQPVAASAPLLLAGRELRKSFVRTSTWWQRRTVVPVFEGADLYIRRGEVVGLTGRSGSGKSTLGRCLLGLIRLDGGQLDWRGTPLSTGIRRSRRERRLLQVIFQNPYGALTPRMTVRQLLAEPLRVHRIVAPREVDRRVTELLALVKLAPELGDRYANQLSGGERQRICIARALSVEPQLLVCDECLSALDRAHQLELLELLLDLRDRLQLAYLFISHDLPLVGTIADRVYHLADGRLTEQPRPGELHEPSHQSEQ